MHDEWECREKRFVCYAQGQGHSKGSYDNMTVSNISSEVLAFLPPYLVILSKSVLWRSWIVVFKVKVTAKFQNISECYPDDIFWIIELFTTKDGIVMHHYEPDCLPKRSIYCFQGQGYSEGSYNQNIISNISSELLILVWWHIIISWIVLWKDWIALLWSRSRSQKRFIITVTVHLMISPQLHSLL